MSPDECKIKSLKRNLLLVIFKFYTTNCFCHFAICKLCIRKFLLKFYCMIKKKSQYFSLTSVMCRILENIIANKVTLGAYKQYVGSVVKWLEHCAYNQQYFSAKPTCAILLCSWERHFTLLGGLGKQF